MINCNLKNIEAQIPTNDNKKKQNRKSKNFTSSNGRCDWSVVVFVLSLRLSSNGGRISADVSPSETSVL